MPKFLLTQCRSLDCTFMFHFMRKWERRQTVAFCCTTLQENPVLVPPRPLPRNQKHRKIQIYLEEYLVGNKLFLIVWWAESICGWCFRPSGHINCTIFIQICKWVLIIMFPSLKKECYWFLCVTHPICIRPMSSMCVFWVSWLVWTWDGRTSPSYLAGTLFACFLCVSFCTNFLKHNMCAHPFMVHGVNEVTQQNPPVLDVCEADNRNYSWKTRLTAGSCWSCWTILMDFFKINCHQTRLFGCRRNTWRAEEEHADRKHRSALNQRHRAADKGEFV